jgi:universal stress protein A
MFKKLLLPVDLSERHQGALDIARELARQSGGTVVLLHVIEIIPGLPMDEEKPFYDRLDKIARKHLSRLGERLQQGNVAWQPEVLYGNRPAETVKYATDKGVDLIVLTAPHFDPKNLSAGWGSLSYKIGVLAQCPVLLVK